MDITNSAVSCWEAKCCWETFCDSFGGIWEGWQNTGVGRGESNCQSLIMWLGQAVVGNDCQRENSFMECRIKNQTLFSCARYEANFRTRETAEVVSRDALFSSMWFSYFMLQQQRQHLPGCKYKHNGTEPRKPWTWRVCWKSQLLITEFLTVPESVQSEKPQKWICRCVHL